MTTGKQLAAEYTFTAPITSRGRQGSNWKLEFDWKLPGSQYPFVLYGRDDDEIGMSQAGDTVRVNMTQGNLKSGKTGQYPTDFFYDLVSIKAAIAPEPRPQPATATATPPPARSVAPAPKPQPAAPPRRPEEPQPIPQALGACQNHAMALIESGIIPVPEGRNPVNFLWELRDRVYRGVNKNPYHNEPFCYEHETPRILSGRKVWGHVLADGTACVDATTGNAAPPGGASEEMDTEAPEGP